MYVFGVVVFEGVVFFFDMCGEFILIVVGFVVDDYYVFVFG